MRIINVEQNTPEWLDMRKGRVMGSIAADVIPKTPTKDEVMKELKAEGIMFDKTELTGVLTQLLPFDSLMKLRRNAPRKVGFYQLLADLLAMPPMDEEDAMQRGHDLENEALAMLSEQIGKKVHDDIGICVRDDEPRIANSPDGMIKNTAGKWVGAAEVKCLKSALHIKAVLENKIPNEAPYQYWSQAMQYFVVNDDLETLYFVFYDPRFTPKPLHIIEVHRNEIEDTVAKLLGYQRDTLKEVDDISAGWMF